MSRLRLLDTNRLIAHWWRSRKGPLQDYSRADATSWADRLIALDGTAATLTPVVAEFLCGTLNRHELDLSRAYLGRFTIVDEGRITPEDWQKALDFAAWVPRDPKPRHFVDCLIAALAKRLGYEILTSDLDLLRRSST